VQGFLLGLFLCFLVLGCLETVGFGDGLLPCAKRNVKQLPDQSELHKGTLFSAFFLPDFRVAGERFILLGAGYRGSMCTTNEGIRQGSW